MAGQSILMVMNRTVTLASTLGHIVNFKKDEEIFVPAILAREAASMGAVAVDGSDMHAEPVSEKPTQPVSPSERLDVVRRVVEEIIEDNLREDFTASGNPKVTIVSERAGFKVDGTEVKTVLRERAEDADNES